MASTYLNLYQNSARLVTPGFQGSSSSQSFDNYNPHAFQGIGGGKSPTYVNGSQEKVVHDTLNNKYYGTQKQSTLVGGINASIARLQKHLSQGRQAVASNYYWGGQGGGYNMQNLTAQDRVDKTNQIKSQQSYLNHINNGGYKQEANTFFDSYDAYTGDYNNIYTRNYNNAQQTAKNKVTAANNAAQKEKNRLQVIENDKTASRNQKIKGENDAAAHKAKQEATQVATGSQARAKKLSPNLEINTGISAQADKLVKSLNSTGLGI